jgi:hypothetical protein
MGRKGLGGYGRDGGQQRTGKADGPGSTSKGADERGQARGETRHGTDFLTGVKAAGEECLASDRTGSMVRCRGQGCKHLKAPPHRVRACLPRHRCRDDAGSARKGALEHACRQALGENRRLIPLPVPRHVCFVTFFC